MKWWWVVLASACATTPAVSSPPPAPAPPAPVRDARALATARFRDAVKARRFSEVLPMLSKRWRDRYDAASLERDFDTEPLAAFRSALPLTLVEEDGGWKVDSLE